MRTPWSFRAGLVGGVLVALGLVAYWVIRVPEIRATAVAQLDRDLERSAHALAAGIPPAELRSPELDVRVKAAARAAHLRFTVVAADGRVVAESDVVDLGTVENHATRPEIAEARRAGVAVSGRTSGTVNRALRYAAVRIPGTEAVARAALDASEVDAFVREETRFRWGPAALATVVAAILAGTPPGPDGGRRARRGGRALGAPVRRPRDARVPVRGPDFLRGLSTSFNSMADRLQGDVERERTERARLQAVLDDMNEGVASIDREERIVFLNRVGRELLAVPAGASVEGQPIHHLVRDPVVLATIRAALRGAEPPEEDVVWDGAPKRLLRVRAAPVERGARGAILLVGDVSTIRRLERMRTDFVANVSHELRTPLAAIAGAAETLSGGALHDAQAGPKFLDTITRHADRLKALVDDLLTLSRLESSPESIERVPVDFALVARQSCEAVASRARDAGLSLEVHAEGALRVLGDPEALRRLVDNLVVNAVTYTPTGGWVRVTVATAGARAVLTVADSGIGIPPEHIERIFERFFRVDKARSRSKGGTGLGLAIVKHAVNLHGGQVAVDSRPGAGSTFTVSIPLSKDGDHPSDAA